MLRQGENFTRFVHEGGVSYAGFSSDCTRVITASEDGGARVCQEPITGGLLYSCFDLRLRGLVRAILP